MSTRKKKFFDSLGKGVGVVLGLLVVLVGLTIYSVGSRSSYDEGFGHAEKIGDAKVAEWQKRAKAPLDLPEDINDQLGQGSLTVRLSVSTQGGISEKEIFVGRLERNGKELTLVRYIAEKEKLVLVYHGRSE